MLAKPARALGVDDLSVPAHALQLTGEEE